MNTFYVMAINIFLILIQILKITVCASNRLTKHFPADPQVVNIVGLFGITEENEKLAFEAAVREINKDSNILKKTLLENHTEIIDLHNSFNIKKTLCSKMLGGITAVFGGNSESGVAIVQSISNDFQIPYIFSNFETLMRPNSSSVNIFPQMKSLTQGIDQIIHDMDWVSFTLLYEFDENLIFFQELLMSHDKLKNEENYSPITLRQLPENEDYGPLLKDIRNSTETRIVLSCALDKIIPVLRKARNLNLMGVYFAYVIVSLDTHIIDLNEFLPTNTNITILSLIEQKKFIEEEMEAEEERVSLFIRQSFNKVKTQAFLIYDSVYLFAKALDTFLENEKLNEVSLNCENEKIFAEGQSLINFIKSVNMKTVIRGITSPIKINDYGERNFYILQIIQMSPKERNKLGTWDPEFKIGYTRNRTQMIQDAEEFIANKTFIVSSILGQPYLMRCKETKSTKAENTNEDCYEGFSKDLIDLIAKDQKFSYKIVVAPDGKRGSRNPVTGKWDGIIKELQERRADLGICDLTITHERRKAVDFTKPFMNLGISILYRKGKEEETHLFSFLFPLRFQVWLCVATALLGISIILFIVSRFTPYDWESSHPCDSNADELENALSLVNCLWFSLGSVLQQGCDILPKAPSSRVVASMWWFFTLIMVSTYTANLAAFLTSQQMESEIKDVEALAAQSVVKYGSNIEGSTATFFQNSNDNLYQKIWATMESTKPSVFTKDNNEGRDRVLRDRQYAFFMESSTIEYMVERNCELTQVGGLLDNKGYGIAMPLNSPYRTQITTALLKQQENGYLRDIKEKWWVNNDTDTKCPQLKKDNEEKNALDVSNVGGVFVVLIIGITFSFILSILEFLWNIRKVAVVEKLPLSVAFWKELHFVLNCHISTKPVRKPSEDPTDKYEIFTKLSNNTQNKNNT